MGKKIISSVILVVLSILIVIILFQLFQIITGGRFSIEEFIYTLLVSEVGFFLPFLLYFYLFNLIRKFLATKSPDIFKIQNQYLLGLTLMLVMTLFLALVIIVARGLSLSEIPGYLLNYVIVLVFVPVIISLEYIYHRKFNSK